MDRVDGREEVRQERLVRRLEDARRDSFSINIDLQEETLMPEVLNMFSEMLV